MKIIKAYNNSPTKFWCDITFYLDEMMGFKSVDFKFFRHYLYRHYLSIDNKYKDSNTINIRIPGRTIGTIITDKNDIIIDIKIIRSDYSNIYPKKIDEIIKEKFIGEQIELNGIEF